MNTGFYLQRDWLISKPDLATLRKHGYDGYISIEHAMKGPFRFAEHNRTYLRKLFDRLGV